MCPCCWMHGPDAMAILFMCTGDGIIYAGDGASQTCGMWRGQKQKSKYFLAKNKNQINIFESALLYQYLSILFVSYDKIG